MLRLPLTGYPPRTWVAIVALGLVSQLAAYFALVYALGHLPATLTSVGLLAQVPCTAFLAWLLLGEPLTSVQVAGGAVVLTGIYVVNRAGVAVGGDGDRGSGIGDRGSGEMAAPEVSMRALISVGVAAAVALTAQLAATP